MRDCRPTTLPDDIDIDAIRARYRQERDRRLRSDRAQQFRAAVGELRDYHEHDPYCAPQSRSAVAEDCDVVVLGAGFAGLLAAARLAEVGVRNLRIIDMAADFGGVWYWNRYPGVQCDIESYNYLPLLEELGYVPKDRYAYGPEIFAHCQAIGKKFDLYRHALLSTVVRSVRWRSGIDRWEISTNRGDLLRARFFIMAPGPLNRPRLPGVKGIERFKGHSFHSSRWDYDYTGGDTNGGLHKLRDKRVAIIGTAASAIQAVPKLAADAGELYVFQRTPSYVLERHNAPTDPEWQATLTPGWTMPRHRSLHRGIAEGFAADEEDLICDGWTEVSRNVQAALAKSGLTEPNLSQIAALRELEEHKVAERNRRRIEEIVEDPTTAEALKPWYRLGCKRIGFSDEYLPAFNRPNVHLIDVADAKGIEEITEDGIVANGAFYPVDCIIYASGFEVSGDLKRRLGIEAIDGADGFSLYDNWAQGYRTFHGLTTHGFPNFLYSGYTQVGANASITLGYDDQAIHIAYIVSQVLKRDLRAVEPTLAAQEAWGAAVRERAYHDAEFWQSCTPGYYNAEGEAVLSNPIYGDPFIAPFGTYPKILEDWRREGNLAGMTLT